MGKMILFLQGLFLIILLSNTNFSHAQKTETSLDDHAIFDQALELFENQKYGAAQERFQQYLKIGESELLKSDARFYTARSAMELYQKQTPHRFKEYIERYPEKPKLPLAYFNLGKYHFREKEFDKATQWLAKIKSNPTIAAHKNEYQFMLGYGYYKKKEYAKAKKAFEPVIERSNNYYALANYYYGYIAYQNDNYASAITNFKKIQGDEKFSKIVPVYITQFYLMQGKYQEAAQYGKEALDQKKIGKKDEIRSFIGEANYHLEQYDQVIKYLEPLAKKDFNFTSEQHYELGFALFKDRKFEASLPQLKALQIQEDTLGQNSSFHLGMAYLHTGEKLKARNSFLFASGFSYDPEIKKRASFNYAKISYDLNYQKEAIQKLRAFAKEYPGTNLAKEAQSLLGDILLATQNFKQALEIIEEIPERGEEIKGSYQKITYQYGLEKFKNKNYKDARELFIKSIRNAKNPKYKALAYFWLAESYFNLQNYSSAYREYKNFLYVDASKNTPYHTLGHYNLGYSKFQEKAYQKALAHFEDFINVKGKQDDRNTKKYKDGLLRIADCHFALKNYDQATSYYSKVINQGGRNVPYALYQRGIIKGLKNQPEAKIANLKSISLNHSSSTYVDDALFEIANTYFAQSNYNLATNQFRYLIQDFQESPYYRAALLKIGLIHYNKKEDQQATQQFKKIISEYPYSEEAKEAMSTLRSIYIEKGQADSLFTFLDQVPNAELSASLKDSLTYSSAFSHMSRNNCNKAIPEFKDYINQYEKGYYIVQANYYLGTCLARQGNSTEAAMRFEEVISRSPNKFLEQALENAARIYYEQDNCVKGLPRFAQLEKIANQQKNLLFALSGQVRCHFDQNNTEKTLKKAQQIINLNYASSENTNEARFYMGKTYLKKGDTAKALQSLKQVAESDNSERGAEAQYLVAETQFNLGKLEQAKKSIYVIRDVFTGYDYWVAKGFILLSDVFVAMDDPFQAKHTLKSVIDNYEGAQLKQIAKKKLEQVKALEAQQKDEKEEPRMVPDTVKQQETPQN